MLGGLWATSFLDHIAHATCAHDNHEESSWLSCVQAACAMRSIKEVAHKPPNIYYKIDWGTVLRTHKLQYLSETISMREGGVVPQTPLSVSQTRLFANVIILPGGPKTRATDSFSPPPGCPPTHPALRMSRSAERREQCVT